MGQLETYWERREKVSQDEAKRYANSVSVTITRAVISTMNRNQEQSVKLNREERVESEKRNKGNREKHDKEVRDMVSKIATKDEMKKDFHKLKNELLTSSKQEIVERLKGIQEKM